MYSRVGTTISNLFAFQNELFLELQYADPRDSKLYTEPGADPEGEEELIYKLYVGGEYYYCKPYRPNYQQVKVRSGTANSSSTNHYHQVRGK